MLKSASLCGHGAGGGCCAAQRTAGVEWEETWWESSDWSGMREMGAQKVGCNAGGRRVARGVDRESVPRGCHGRAVCGAARAQVGAGGSEAGVGRRSVGEHYGAAGAVNKFAEKWGRSGPDVRSHPSPCSMLEACSCTIALTGSARQSEHHVGTCW